MKYPRYKIVLALIDYCIIRIAFSAALQLRGISYVHGESWWLYIQSPEFVFFFFYSFLMVLIFQSKRLYKIDVFLSRSLQVVAIIQSFLYAMTGLAIIAFCIRSTWVIDSRLAVIYFFLIGFFSIVTFRVCIYRPIFMYLGGKWIRKKNVIIVGTNPLAKYFALKLWHENIYGLKLAGFVDDTFPTKKKIFKRFEVLGHVKDVPRLVKELDVHDVFIALSDTDYPHLMKLLDICKKSSAQISIISPRLDVINKKLSPEMYFNIPFIGMTNYETGHQLLFMKRSFDFFVSFLILLIAAPVLLIIAAAIKLSSKGPVFHTQIRIGKDGREFKFYKFRSMVLGSHEDSDREKKAKEFVQAGKSRAQGSTKIVNTSKITPIGGFLRKTSLDEVPQLLNVLKGDMSLVGPRPCLPYEYAVYDDWHKKRVAVLPGCTGLWQVSSRSEVGFDDMVLLDLYYNDNMSPWLDLQLLLKTIPAMAFGKGGK
jgi:undecaprenyl-phosphate galactose phosphotransferase